MIRLTSTTAALVALLFAGPTWAQNGIHTIVDGPGAGQLVDATGGVVNSGGDLGSITGGEAGCPVANTPFGPTDFHFHGSLNGVGDPNPGGCGHGRVVPGDFAAFFQQQMMPYGNMPFDSAEEQIGNVFGDTFGLRNRGFMGAPLEPPSPETLFIEAFFRLGSGTDSAEKQVLGDFADGSGAPDPATGGIPEDPPTGGAGSPTPASTPASQQQQKGLDELIDGLDLSDEGKRKAKELADLLGVRPAGTGDAPGQPQDPGDGQQPPSVDELIEDAGFTEEGAKKAKELADYFGVRPVADANTLSENQQQAVNQAAQQTQQKQQQQTAPPPPPSRPVLWSGGTGTQDDPFIVSEAEWDEAAQEIEEKMFRLIDESWTGMYNPIMIARRMDSKFLTFQDFWYQIEGWDDTVMNGGQVNYFMQGMFWQHAGMTWNETEAIIRGWKIQYDDKQLDNVLVAARKGYEHMQDRAAEREAEIDIDPNLEPIPETDLSSIAPVSATPMPDPQPQTSNELSTFQKMRIVGNVVLGVLFSGD